MKRFHISTIIVAGLIVLILSVPMLEGVQLPLLILVFVLYGMVLIYGASQVKSQFFMRTLCRGDKAVRKIAITFDDGPCGERSLEILELLQKHDCRASFFLIGNSVRKHPEIVRTMVNRGHLVGNHSLSHSNLFPFFRSSRIRREVEECNRILEEAGSGPIRFFRPPFGVTNPNIARGLKNSGMEVAGWSIRSFDTQNQAASKVVKRISKRMGGGEVILLHESSEHILEILEQLLPAIDRAGLSCVTLDQMFDSTAK